LAPVMWFGDAPAACEVLDGVLLGVRRAALVEKEVYFDQRFDFHFYDLDFCRTARSKALQPGTRRIPITHARYGGYGSPQWVASRERYRLKWGD